MGNKDLSKMRREYSRSQLDESKLPDDPLELFTVWMDQARASGIADPTAMTLSTVESNGHPSSRIVLLKTIEAERLVFFTSYRSRKAHEIRAQARVATHFYWPELERQVRIAGKAVPIEDDESDRYFQNRPFESKIA